MSLNGWNRSGSVGGSLVVALALSAVFGCSSAKKKTSTSPDGGGGDGQARDDSAAGAAGADAGSAADAGDDVDADAAIGGGGTAGAAGAAPFVGDSVLMLHRNPSHDGVYVQPTFTKAALAQLDVDATFKATLPNLADRVYAQPLFVDGGPGGEDLLIVATEANNVYALDAATGFVIWMKNLGAPVPLTKMACGNLDSYGVTGTPVIDLASRQLFVTAAVLPASGVPTYEIFALSLADGAIAPGWPVDVPTIAVSGATTFKATSQGQRGALALVGGTLYVPFGGLYGACQPYRGWIVAVSIADPTAVKVWANSAAGGGLWAPGGIASDGTSLFVGTGVTFQTSTWAGGDGVLRFGTGAAFGAPEDSFAPGNWAALDPADLGSGAAPVLFTLPGATPSALAIFFQKDGNAYLLDQAHLGGVGAALGATGVGTTPYATANVSPGAVISVPAVYKTAAGTYVTFKGQGQLNLCPGGANALTTIEVLPGAPPTLRLRWCRGVGTGSPMVTTSNGTDDTIIWLPGAEATNHLQAFDGDTGTPLDFPGAAATIPGMRRFISPIAAKGRIYVASDGAVTAFKLP
jgi:outer membrane protein assembly factor BamB